MILKIAWGSLRRHGRRSILIVIAIAISVATMEFLGGVMSGMREDFFETMVSSGGHLQVEHVDAEEALDPTSLDLLIADWNRYRQWFLDQPEVVRAEPVLTFGALVVKDGTNAPMIGYGILPDTEFFSDVRGGIQEGRFLTVPPSDGSSGATAPREILVSTETAKMLDLALADQAMLLVEDSTGAPYYLDYEVVGVFRSDSGEFDESSFLITHTDAQELLYVGNETREIRVSLTSDDTAVSMADRFAIAFGATRDASASSGAPGDAGGAVQPGDAAPQNASSNGPAPASSAPGAPADSSITVRTWREIQGGTVVLIEMFDIFMYAINFFIVIVAATVITNAILMNVFEKTAEYGMMRAIGLKNRGVVGLVLAEGTAYGVAGSILGLALGIPLVLYFQTHGINFGEVMESFGMGREITTTFRPGTSVVNALFGALTAIAGSLYAALVSRRRTIIESIRGTA